MSEEAFLYVAFTEAADAARKHWPTDGLRFPHMSMLITGDCLRLEGYEHELVVTKRMFSIEKSGQARIQLFIDLAQPEEELRR